MTKKDYELIAQAIADVWCDSEAQLLIAESLSRALWRENSRFNSELFLAACGVK
jgi:hypothetical protein